MIWTANGKRQPGQTSFTADHVFAPWLHLKLNRAYLLKKKKKIISYWNNKQYWETHSHFEKSQHLNISAAIGGCIIVNLLAEGPWSASLETPLRYITLWEFPRILWPFLQLNFSFSFPKSLANSCLFDRLYSCISAPCDFFWCFVFRSHYNLLNWWWKR